ncbi:MAG: sulfite exporter TauE/SafE family protein [Phycisphaerales bacterium]|nr:sulfite exporter TauE/SafE family protein [Phycisphaerales bacterium]
MGALIATVFAASLLGSAHCAGMCGAFVAFAVGIDDPQAARKRARLHAAYNLGRLLTYTVLGAVAGALGGALDLAGSMAGLSRVAAALAGAMLIVFGATHLLRAMGLRIAQFRPPRFMQQALRAANRAAMTLPPVRRAVVIGLMTTLLPCGWLYAFVAAAAGTGSAPLGALTMGAFWLGTLPMMVAVGVGVRALAGPLASRLPFLMPLLVMAAGLFTIFSRVSVSVDALRSAAAKVETTSLESLSSSVKGLDAESMPCCSGEPPVVEPAAPPVGDAASACPCEHCAQPDAACDEPCGCCDAESPADDR